MVAKFYGKSYSLQHLRLLSHITREGVSMLGISDAAEAIGFRTKGVKLTWEQLRDEVPFPCIAHWRQNHFMLALLVGSLISRIFPFITQSVVDFGINNSNLNFIILALVAQMVLTFGQTANELIRSWLMLHVTTRMSINIVSDFLSTTTVLQNKASTSHSSPAAVHTITS